VRYEAALSAFEQALENIAADLAVLTEQARALGHDALAQRLSEATTALTPPYGGVVGPLGNTEAAAVRQKPAAMWAAPSEYSRALNTMTAMLDYVAREAERVGAYDIMAAALSGCELARQTRPQPTRQ
jgi:hypothetical protein